MISLVENRTFILKINTRELKYIKVKLPVPKYTTTFNSYKKNNNDNKKQLGILEKPSETV